MKTVKVVLVGESGAGKTALLTAFLDNSFNADPLTTIGIDFKHKIVTLSDGQSIRLQLWDTAGQERFRQLTPAYIRGAQVALLVIDLSDVHAAEHLIRWKGVIDMNKSPFTSIIIVGNKCDLIKELVPRKLLVRLRTLINATGHQYIETSAKSWINVKELFTMVTCRPFPEHETSEIVLCEHKHGT